MLTKIVYLKDLKETWPFLELLMAKFGLFNFFEPGNPGWKIIHRLERICSGKVGVIIGNLNL